jgi:hypothetical protein
MAEWMKFDGSEEHGLRVLSTESMVKIRTTNGQEVNIKDFLLSDFRREDIYSFLICEPHPHRDMIIEWANTGRPVYVKMDGGWELDESPRWLHDVKYSFDPPREKVRYRVAMMKADYCGSYTRTADYEKDVKNIESSNEFVRWLTEWQEVEV